MKRILFFVSLIICCISYTQKINAQTVGRKAAEKYFISQKQLNDENSDRSSNSKLYNASLEHYLLLHIGGFLSSESFLWSTDKDQEDIGKFNLGFSYKIGEWVRSMDLLFRMEHTSFKFADGTAGKISFLPIITLPEVSSRFPLYFGGGVGLGVLYKQINRKSALSLDYQFFFGLRFFNLFNNGGIFIESGIKNHFHLTSDGQFNSVFVTSGLVFTF